ncbi:MAG: hypothetical protein LAP39_00260 [Acidobacteriia bacterium]|nr:hypothetical protein [Terriglobia bacterium]
MVETLQKLRPDRDLQCYFLEPSAAAALSGTSPTGFTISGSWRQQFDWVVIEWNRENTFEHPAFRNLPDGDLSGVVLTYDEIRQSCLPIDSTLYPTVDWPSLRIWADPGGVETLYKVPIKSHATPIAGSYQPATATFTLTGTLTADDWVELAWSLEHYSHKVVAGDTLDTVVQAIADAINNVPSPTMRASSNGSQITLTYIGAGQTLESSTVGANGNRIGVYGNVQADAGPTQPVTESWSPWFQKLSGGTSPTQWRVSLDFSNLLADDNTTVIPTHSVRKMRWTYAADFQAGSYQRSEFQVTVSNWMVSGSNLTYQVAGPGSRRIEDTSLEVVYSGNWSAANGNFSGGTIHVTTTPGDSVSCTYRASQAHQLYLGTRKAVSGAEITAVVDQQPAIGLNLFLALEDVLVRIPLGTFSGQDTHTVTLTHGVGAGSFYFDFLELAVPTTTLPVFAPDARMTLATDWDTDHSIALAPERTARMIQALGFAGRANHYAGALRHYEMVPQNYTYASATVQFDGTPTRSAVTTLNVGPTAIQHVNLFGDTAVSIAKAFELEINSGYTGIWAQASGNVLTIYSREIGGDGNAITISADPASGTFALLTSGSTLAGGTGGSAINGGNDENWVTDLTVVPRMNRAARDWCRSFFGALQGYGIAATGAFSMELGHGDRSPEAGIAQVYPSGNAVWLNTPALQTNFSPMSTAFWKQAYLDMAAVMSDAGQVPYLQFGEVQWWYFPDDGSGMPYYDAYTMSTFAATYGRAMQVFTNSTVSPSSYPQEAAFLPGLIGAFTSAVMSFVRQTFPSAKFEVLYPPDTNDTPWNGAVNLPSNWNPATLNCLKTENFTFTGGRNLKLARNSILLPMQMGFAQSQSSHLVGITGYTTPWQKEARLSLAENLESVVLFALDQFCLMSCPAPMPVGARRAVYMGVARGAA